MSLKENQFIFSKDLAKFLAWLVEKNIPFTMGECYRTREQAKLNVASGVGILNSLHCDRLAIDLNLFTPEGAFKDDIEYYRPAGEYWKSLNPQNAWGGDFKTRHDPYHFSRSWQGRK